MKRLEFNYSLPENLIASYPLKRRDKARLMIIDRKHGTIRDDCFANIGQYLPPESLIVLNNSKVIPARLLGKRSLTGGQVEIFVLNKIGDGYIYETLMRPLKRLKVGERIKFGKNGLIGEILDKDNKLVRFNKKNILPYLKQIGHMPLPPYIKRSDQKFDRKYYQTVYAKDYGSVAAPTAGLHFTTQLLKNLIKAGHTIEKLTLHVNYATFKPVEEEDIIHHRMHSEEYCVPKRTIEKVIKAKNESRAIIAVGTTSCRVLEALALQGIYARKNNDTQKGSTNLFIYPGFRFLVIDALITNFHLPYSTLLMLVYAFGGTDFMRRAYEQAIKEKYRFYSYGDAMIIL